MDAWPVKPLAGQFDSLVRLFPQAWIINRQYVDFQRRAALLWDLALPPAASFLSQLDRLNERKLVFLESFGESRIGYYYGHASLDADDREPVDGGVVNIPLAPPKADLTGVSMFELCKLVYLVQHLNLVKIFDATSNSPILPIQKWLKLPGKQASYLVIAFQLYLQNLLPKSVVSDLIAGIERQTKVQLSNPKTQDNGTKFMPVPSHKSVESDVLSRSTQYELMALIVTLRQVIRSNLKSYETKMGQQMLDAYANAGELNDAS